MGATVHVLTSGYVGERVAGTVTLVRDGDLVAVVDPGMVAHRGLILDPLAELGVRPEQVTDVIHLKGSREKLLALRPTLIIPGHSPAFTPTP